MNPEDLDPGQFRLLESLTREDLAALVPMLEARKLARGRWLFREGGESDGLFLVRSGEVELSAERTGTAGTVEAGAALGELSLVSVGTRELGAKTAAPCELWCLPRGQWHRLVEDHPRTACRLLEAILRETAATLREALDGLADEDFARGGLGASEAGENSSLH
jgi:CRP-like cAMP-binding protein